MPLKLVTFGEVMLRSLPGRIFAAVSSDPRPIGSNVRRRRIERRGHGRSARGRSFISNSSAGQRAYRLPHARVLQAGSRHRADSPSAVRSLRYLLCRNRSQPARRHDHHDRRRGAENSQAPPRRSVSCEKRLNMASVSTDREPANPIREDHQAGWRDALAASVAQPEKFTTDRAHGVVPCSRRFDVAGQQRTHRRAALSACARISLPKSDAESDAAHRCKWCF